ncbi:MAG TPA: peptidoglycan DD-metalloendopeptidase family protein [Methanomicrobiales archaeon]|jgi:murein DD-endopeptidase MepM/ murein hydrolase activator NlpD|nr:peptidoglycan DD-metalloendopeptidase family protein [Methanomicrobiales archaeon]
MDPSRRRLWPLPGIGRVFPEEGTPGSFWEDRGDRFHAGVDLYAPTGSPVVAIEDGRVISAGIFTSPDLVPYWNRTYQVTLAHASGIFCRYAELGDIPVEQGASVRGGWVIGHVGEVLNLSLIGPGAPPYIRALKDQGHDSMLHLETYGLAPGTSPEYRGGNWFSRIRPAHLLDPAPFLRDTS